MLFILGFSMSWLLTSVETCCWVSSLRHPITACYPCQGCRGFADTGGFHHPAVLCLGEAWAGGSEQQGARLPSAGQQGCTAAGMRAVCSPVAPLAEGRKVATAHWHRASPTQHLGSPAVIYDSKGLPCQKSIHPEKTNSLGKRPQPWKALTLQTRGCQEAKPRERYKSLHLSEFSLSDSCIHLHEYRVLEKNHTQHISAGWSHGQLNVSHQPHLAQRKSGLDCRRSADGRPDFGSRNPPK